MKKINLVPSKKDVAIATHVMNEDGIWINVLNFDLFGHNSKPIKTMVKVSDDLAMVYFEDKASYLYKGTFEF